MIKTIWNAVRPVPKRFYKYGTIGLNVFDDRTLFEKICDWIDRYIEISHKRHIEHGRAIWNTYFDIGINDYISSYSQIKKIEKEKGWAYLTPREIHEEAKKGHEDRKKASEERTRRKFEKAITEIQQGRSFVKEIQRDINKNKYQIGSVNAFNGS
jgi:predicted metal-dependent peptidase